MSTDTGDTGRLMNLISSVVNDCPEVKQPQQFINLLVTFQIIILVTQHNISPIIYLKIKEGIFHLSFSEGSSIINPWYERSEVFLIMIYSINDQNDFLYTNTLVILDVPT